MLVKVKNSTIEFLKSGVLDDLKLSPPLNETELEIIRDYLEQTEISLTNLKELDENLSIEREFYLALCDASDDLLLRTDEQIDINNLNNRLIK